MTDKRDTGAGGHRGAMMNRMMPDTYEKRGMTTAHLRQALDKPATSTVKPRPIEEAPALPTPKADG